VLAFEVARRLETLVGRRPVLVFVSGSRAPSRYGDEQDGKDDVVTHVVNVVDRQAR